MADAIRQIGARRAGSYAALVCALHNVASVETSGSFVANACTSRDVQGSSALLHESVTPRVPSCTTRADGFVGARHFMLDRGR